MKRIVSLLLLLAVCLTLAAGAAGNAGSASNPLITLSYLNQTYLPQITTNIQSRVNTGWTAVLSPFGNNLKAKFGDALTRLGVPTAAVKAKVQAKDARLLKTVPANPRSVNLAVGAALAGREGSTFILKSGGGKVNVVCLDLSAGQELAVGGVLLVGHEYLLLSASVVTATAASVLIVDGGFSGGAPAGTGSESSYIPQNTDMANALKAMGLFLGVNGDYQLGRAATRLEALIMMLRFLGEEDEALSITSYQHPYTDVPYWANDNANKYVGYAHAKGYTNGVSPTRFDPGGAVTDAMYMTYLLRALGYSSAAGGDFQWDKSLTFAQSRGVLTAGEVSAIQADAFRRDQMVYLSYYSLFVTPKGKSGMLLEDLIACGAVPADTARSVTANITRQR